VEDDLRQANQTFHEREGYTTALANIFDPDVEANLREQEDKCGLMQTKVMLGKQRTHFRK
jgi:hypothetical protein